MSSEHIDTKYNGQQLPKVTN